MRSILLPVHPDIIANILNGKANTLIRKLFPKDYVGWVYVYCTKGNKELCHYRMSFPDWKINKYKICSEQESMIYKDTAILNGKVCCRFWCDKVEDIVCYCCGKDISKYKLSTNDDVEEFIKKSCLQQDEIDEYLNPNRKREWGVYGYAVYISKLEVFEKPRELDNFYKEPKQCNVGCFKCFKISWQNYDECKNIRVLTNAPQNYCYIESEE